MRKRNKRSADAVQRHAGKRALDAEEIRAIFENSDPTNPETQQALDLLNAWHTLPSETLTDEELADCSAYALAKAGLRPRRLLWRSARAGAALLTLAAIIWAVFMVQADRPLPAALDWEGSQFNALQAEIADESLSLETTVWSDIWLSGEPTNSVLAAELEAVREDLLVLETTLY